MIYLASLACPSLCTSSVMRSLEQDPNHKKNSNTGLTRSRSSTTSVLLSSSSSSSYSKPFFSASSNSFAAMEEVWDDINLTVLHPPIAGAAPAHQPSRTLQDFFNVGPVDQPLAISLPPEEALPLLPLRPPRPPPVLSLNTGVATFCNSAPAHGQSAYFLVPPPPAAELSCSKRRLPETAANDADRHNRRMIKNREAAARSRARKQAYTNELELEALHLKEENAKLKKEYEELRMSMTSKPPKRSPLQRSITAPF